MPESRLEKLLEFLKNEPNDEFLKYALATEYLRLNDTGNALLYYEDLVTNHADYVGTYYHLGKLLERKKEKKEAEETYREGLRRTFGKEQHTYAELQQALNDLLYDDE